MGKLNITLKVIFQRSLLFSWILCIIFKELLQMQMQYSAHIKTSFLLMKRKCVNSAQLDHRLYVILPHLAYSLTQTG